MKKFSTKSALLLLFSFLVIDLAAPKSFALDRVKQIAKDLKDYKNLEVKIKRQGARLSEAQKSRLKAVLPNSTTSRLEDSDDDGVPNIIEHGVDGSDECSSSSHEGGTEAEIKGQVVTIAGSTFVIGSQTFDINGSTEYSHGSSSDLIVGACVEVSAATQSGTTNYLAREVSFKDASKCVHS